MLANLGIHTLQQITCGNIRSLTYPIPTGFRVSQGTYLGPTRLGIRLGWRFASEPRFYNGSLNRRRRRSLASCDHGAATVALYQQQHTHDFIQVHVETESRQSIGKPLKERSNSARATDFCNDALGNNNPKLPAFFLFAGPNYELRSSAWRICAVATS
jgi:hypothetical protein